MRSRLTALCFSLLCAATAAPTHAAVSISIGINVPAYPQMTVVPGYPVYYAPSLGANFFFYDGMYWVLEGDNWYMSSWYNGPWVFVEPLDVPYYVLRVPVRYYMAPPPYFRGWQSGAPPRWGNHWGPQWEQRSRGWDHWDRRATPGPAPLPTYQRRYSGEHYPGAEQQANLQTRNYHYQPRAEATRQLIQQQQGEHRNNPPVVQQRPRVEQPQVRRTPQEGPPVEQPQVRRTPQEGPPVEPQHRQERSTPPPQEARREGPPRREAEPRMPPQQMRPQPQPQPQPQMPMATPESPPRQQPGRGEPPERGRSKGHGEEGKDKREDNRPPGR